MSFINEAKQVDPNNEQEAIKYDKLIIEDSNDLDKWILKSVIGHKKNRLISYPCDYFHSKYPHEFIDSRIVFVLFYKIEK